MAARPIRDAWLLPTLERILSEAALARLRAVAAESYWEAAVKHGLASDDAILMALASHFRMRLAALETMSPHGRDVIPESLARRYRVVPVHATDTLVEVATADPTDMECERALGFASGRAVRLSLASPLRILEAIDELYQAEAQAASVIAKILENVADKYDVRAITAEDAGDITGMEGHSDRPVIKLVDFVLAEGISSRASDIHLEPEEDGLSVRYRIDGVLRQVLALPRGAGVPLVSRIKIISGLDIADRLRPQDGRARVVVNGKQVDLRVSSLPASHGEKVVIRILDSGATVMSFESMGMNSGELERLQRLLEMREGIILVTGPTGSGKTTTLYTGLRQIQQRGGVNVVTVEDPVEYRLPGIVQVQVNEKAGLTFAAALRSILRQDPDVVLVGEIRDQETARTAVQASLTGHLVFSTLHTLDAASSITRLTDIGVESYKIAAALKGVVAQRLLRRLCQACSVPAERAPAPRLRQWLGEDAALFEARGCPECAGTGYRGRIAVMEVLLVDAEVERRIGADEPVDRVIEAARAGGMRSLWESGVQHARAGMTSLDELLRVLDVPRDADARHPGATRNGHRSSPPAPGLAGTFTPSFGLPALESPPPPPILSPELFRLLDEPDPATDSIARRSTVLLVEDEEPLRLALRDLLRERGYHVLEAHDGVEALELLDRSGVDLMLLDLAMPRLDGAAVLQRIRTRRGTERLPVIAFTDGDDESAEVAALELGANDVLPKPWRDRALLARIAGMLRRSGAPAALHLLPGESAA